MYKLTKDVLETGKFELTDILKKIDTFWLKGNITEEQRNELYELAQSKAKPENSADLLAKVVELEKRVQTLEARITANDSTNEETPEEGEEVVTDEYPEFVVGKWYYEGDKTTFEGAKYVCVAPEGTVCVWSPKDYPTYWEVVNESKT